MADNDYKPQKKPLVFAIIGLFLPIIGLPFSIIALNTANKLVDEHKCMTYILAMVLGGLGILTCFSAALSVIKAIVTG